MKPRVLIVMTAASLGALVCAACEQKEVVLPELESAHQGQCGDWYPGGGEADAGSQETSEYAVAQGSTFPCLVWNSVRQNHEATWLNAGELYLEYFHEETDAKAMILLISSESCPTCLDLVAGLNEYKSELESQAVMMALALNAIASEGPFSLDKAEEILIYHDHWPSDWLVSNDQEGHLSGYTGFPWIVVIRLSDMKVIQRTNLDYNGSNIDTLVDLIDSF